MFLSYFFPFYFLVFSKIGFARNNFVKQLIITLFTILISKAIQKFLSTAENNYSQS
jgi:hypothetical protein